tara:strand:+ start:932 stop:3190 length:2259 start_codon:yes stop_codon:yes gene_type:complete
MEYLSNLNKQQKEAVTQTEGPLMVIAGAGSGKTRVLTYRIAHLIQTGISPYNILALTFTNKAAKEMRERIYSINTNEKINNLWIGTFHSVFAKILRFESFSIGFPSNFTIYDVGDSKNLVKDIIKELNLNKDVYKVGYIRNRISSLKNRYITPEKYNDFPDLVEQDKVLRTNDFSRIYSLYISRCKRAFAMDFDDLILQTLHLINASPEILFKYQNIFKYILIDEYQDTNHSQYLIINKLAKLHQNICVVGDDSQSIYSFRGADIQNILNFKKDYIDFKTIKLEQNYRSSSNIVNAANSLIKKNTHQIKKNIWTENDDGEKITICKADSDHAEAKLIANTISQIKFNNHLLNKDFAILYRTNAQSRSIEEALRRASINYILYGGISFYQRKEVKDVISYFRLVCNPHDEEALKRIINYPSRGIGKTTMQKLIDFSNDINISIWNLVSEIDSYKLNISNGVRSKIKNFIAEINYLIEFSKKYSAYLSAEEILKKTGIISLLSEDKSIEGLAQKENIYELLNGIKEFDENYEQNHLIDFIQSISLLTDQDMEIEKNTDKTVMMTIHAAKGLEFPYVFIVGLEEDLFPSAMSLQSQADIEEERRLFYVAITRAKKRLFISYCQNRFKWGQFISCQKSRFIDEIDDKFLNTIDNTTNEKRDIKYRIKRVNNFKDKAIFKYDKEKLVKVNNIKNSTYNDKEIDKIKEGIRVKHIKFGEGQVLNVSGDGSNVKAEILFENSNKKLLLLKFAKLEILDK